MIVTFMMIITMRMITTMMVINCDGGDIVVCEYNGGDDTDGDDNDYGIDND